MREKWDILWELMSASKKLGIESALLDSKETISDYQDAFNKAMDALDKAVKRLEVMKLWCMSCDNFFTPGEERFDEASGYATDEEVEICEDCARARWEHQEESRVY